MLPWDRLGPVPIDAFGCAPRTWDVDPRKTVRERNRTLKTVSSGGPLDGTHRGRITPLRPFFGDVPVQSFGCACSERHPALEVVSEGTDLAVDGLPVRSRWCDHTDTPD